MQEDIEESISCNAAMSEAPPVKKGIHYQLISYVNVENINLIYNFLKKYTITQIPRCHKPAANGKDSESLPVPHKPSSGRTQLAWNASVVHFLSGQKTQNFLHQQSLGSPALNH